MVLIPATGQRIHDVGVNDDHELSRLPTEALSKQLTGSPGHIGPAAVVCPVGGSRRVPVPLQNSV